METPTPVPFIVWTNDRGEEGFLHGTKADLRPGDLIELGRGSNYGNRENAVFVYLTATLDAATWGAELAIGEGRGRISRSPADWPDRGRPEPHRQEVPGQPDQILSHASPPSGHP